MPLCSFLHVFLLLILKLMRIGVNYLRGWCGTAGKTKKREITPLKIHTEKKGGREDCLTWNDISWAVCLSQLCYQRVYTPTRLCFGPLLGPPLSTGWGFRGFFGPDIFSTVRGPWYILGSYFIRAWRGVNPWFDSWLSNPVVLFAKLQRWDESAPPPLKFTKN